MRLYLSGPITGMPELNRPAFAEAAAKLREAGHTVINPHDVGTPAELLPSWEAQLRDDLVAMLDGADALAQLPGWVDSRGAALEHQVADALGWEVRPWEEWI